MGLLLYKSNEMFSSTELIRKSKMIFDKILGSKIEKAIILRDGKPSFLLMEFSKYEKIMAEYEELKEYVESLEDGTKSKLKKSKKKVSSKNLKSELEEGSKALSIDGGDYSDIKQSQNENDKQEDISKEEETEKKEVIQNPQTSQIKNMVENPSQEDEIQKAYANIEAMDIDDEMKAQGKAKIRQKIMEARKQREEELKQQEQNLQELDKLEDQIQQEKLKKEQELEEFWD